MEEELEKPIEGEDFVFKDINSAAEKITGLTEEESIGKNLYETLPDLELKTDSSAVTDLKDIVGEVQFNSIPNFKGYSLSVSRGIHDKILEGGRPVRRIADFFHASLYPG